MFHPLIGCDLSTLATVLRRNGFVRTRRIPQVLIALAASVLRWPFDVGELVAARTPNRDTSPTAAPIFIVGLWRSGTTHLYNILSKWPGFGFVTPIPTALPWNFLGLARVLRGILERALPPDRFIDRIPVNPDSPQEDEIALANMQPLSFYHGVYFPRRFYENFEAGIFFDGCSRDEIVRWQCRLRHFLRKIAIPQDGARLLVKNPVYTARVAMLRRMWPGAKFIHIYRNPYNVFESSRHFYPVLLRELALQPFDHLSVDDYILKLYPRMIEKLYRDASTLPGSDFVELRFEDLERAPLDEIERIFRVLELGGFEDARPSFEAYLRSVAGYKKNRYPFPAASYEKVTENWQRLIRRWGYDAPEE